MPVPNTFANATGSIPLSQLDNNFATAITIGNTAVQLGNTISTINNATLANVTISTVSTPITVAQGGTGLSTVTANNVLIGNGTGAITTVAPGTSGNVLTSNGTVWSSQAAVSSATQGGFRSGNTSVYSGWANAGSSGNTMSPTASRIYYQVFVCGQTTTWTRIGIIVTTGQAGKVARLGIYNWSGGIATTRVLDAGTVALDSAATVEATISYAMSPGVYALAFIADSTTAAVKASGALATMGNFQYGNDNTNNSNPSTFFYEAGSGTTLPATATATPTVSGGTPPYLYVRY